MLAGLRRRISLRRSSSLSSRWSASRAFLSRTMPFTTSGTRIRSRVTTPCTYFALVLAALFAFRTGHGVDGIRWHEGLVWGLAGFTVFTLAPGLGLPPQLPGVPAAPLLSRQIWWVLAALAAAGGLSLIFLRRT